MPSWKDLVAKSSGNYHIYCKTLDDGRLIEHRPDAVVEGASTIKLPILLALLDRAQSKQLSLRTQVQIRRSQVGRNGSGIIANLHLDAPWSLHNLAVMMMALSDNVATNVIIDTLGHEAINRFIKERLGLQDTRLVMPKIDFPNGYRFTPGAEMSLTTAREMGQLVERLLKGEILNAANTRLAQRLMQQVRTSTANRRLPERSIRKFGSKTGWIITDKDPLAVLNECGYIITRHDRVHVFSIFARAPKGQKHPYTADAAGKINMARIAAALYTELES